MMRDFVVQRLMSPKLFGIKLGLVVKLGVYGKGCGSGIEKNVEEFADWIWIYG
jgi:hypothetical protein